MPPASKLSQAWHSLGVDQAGVQLKTDLSQGLTQAEADKRVKRDGPNTLTVMSKTAWYVVLARQFTDVLILILLVAAVISVLVGELGDALTILVIVVLNGILGFVQEWKAENAIEALQRMLEPRCKVVRDGREQVIDSKELVSGDIVLLEIGDRVPADLRLAMAINLKIDESSLTGESGSVNKDSEPVKKDAPLAEQSSMAWMGTAVNNGRARGIVSATGMNSEFGRIARLTQTVGLEMTPLQHNLAQLGKQLGVLSVAVSIIVALAGWLLGKPFLEMFLTGIALAVAVVPEGLPAVVTITLALGVRAMVRRRALLRRLQAAETLGAATVICTDKTGTLTKNQMTVEHIWLCSGALQVTGVGYDPVGQFTRDGVAVDISQYADLQALLATGLRCNHARINKDENGWHETGEPTEAALVVAASKAGLHPEETVHTIGEFSFNSRRKRMTVIEHSAGGMLAHVKGAPEVILQRCTQIMDKEIIRDMNDSDRSDAVKAYQALASRGLRTLALARRSLPDQEMTEDSVERELTLLGIVGIIDPPHPEVPKAIQVAASAGIRTIMITGDAPATALAIARAIGLPAQKAVTGQELAAMEDARLRQTLAEEVLFARTTPEDKMRIVGMLQEMGAVVGMTGDGVNDAPALKKADIGIAMGLHGTDVAKGAADMILTDDNYASIVDAVEEGRRQYSNIQKFVRYLLSSNMGEVFAIFINILLGGPLILLPVQILWMNLVTDGMTAVALGLEPAEKEIMRQPPRSSRQPIIDKGGVLLILLLGSYIGLVTIWLFHFYLRTRPEQLLLAQTMAFTGIIVLEKMNVFNFRALRTPLFVIGFFTNRWILLAWIFTIGLQVCAVYLPFLQNALHTVALGWQDWVIIFLVAAPIFISIEIYKWLGWRRSQGTS